MDTICLPRPRALASASPASTPLSSLRVCPLSESCESVEAAGRGQQEESGGLYSWGQGGLPGGGDGAAGWKAGGILLVKARESWGSWRAGRLPTILPPTETFQMGLAPGPDTPRTSALIAPGVMIKTEVRSGGKLSPQPLDWLHNYFL